MNYNDYKRFVELYIGDNIFRERFKLSPNDALLKYGIAPQLDIPFLQEFSLCCERYSFKTLKERFPNEVAELNGHVSKMKVNQFGELCLSNRTHNRNFIEWKKRRIAANRASFNPRYFDKNHNISIAYELGVGCSGQCPFCCFATGALEQNFLYTPENALLWKNVLKVFRDLLGEQAGSAALYWATDPFDNPDFEKFYDDFYQVNSIWPPITTRLGLRDISRTRDFIKLGLAKGERKIRLSMVTKAEINQFMHEFTPEEAGGIELVLNNVESLNKYSISGRARDLACDDKLQDYTSSCCLSGFLINMCHRTVKLISPCVPNESDPMGYHTWHEFSFTNEQDLADKLQEVRFVSKVEELPLLKISKDWEVVEFEDRVCFKSQFLEREIKLNSGGIKFVQQLKNGIKNSEIDSDSILFSTQREILETLWKGAMLYEQI